MLNKTNIATGAAMFLAGLGEIAVTRAPCPLCIGAIAGGAGIIVNEIKIKLE